MGTPRLPGFRFHPTDEELLKFYLKNKVMGRFLKDMAEVIVDLNMYKFSPWELPGKSSSKEREWYFFCQREKKYASGSRTRRSTEGGYWKTTGKDRRVLSQERTVGMVKTLVFHIGRAPEGKRTDWVLHEYRIVDEDLANAGVDQDAYVLCKIFEKSGPGPKNGAQYGAPFNEEEWNDDKEDDPSMCTVVLPNNQNSSVLTCTLVPEGTCSMSLSEAGQSNAVLCEPQRVVDDDVGSSLAMLLASENNDNAITLSHERSNETPPYLDEYDMYNGLGDLCNWPEMSEAGIYCGQQSCDALNSTLGDVSFLELNDLDRPLELPAEADGNRSCLELNDLDDPLESLAEDGVYKSFPTDGFCGSHDSYNSKEQRCYFHGGYGAVQNVSGLSCSRVPLEEFCGWSHFQENNVEQNANQGCSTASGSVGFNPRKRQEEEDGHAGQEQKRGEQQRKSYSRLQPLLESMPVPPALAAELLAPTNGAEICKDSILYPLIGAFSIHVKAEVTRGLVGALRTLCQICQGSLLVCHVARLTCLAWV